MSSWSRVVIGMCLLLGVSACTPDSQAQPWDAEIQAAQEKATTPLEREILADGIITDAEFDEAFSRFADCMAGHGYTVTMARENGIYNGFGISGGDPSQETILECETGTIAILEALYVDMRRNPDNVDPYELLAECLRDSGLAPDSFEADDLQSLDDLPFDTTDPRFHECVTS